MPLDEGLWTAAAKGDVRGIERVILLADDRGCAPASALLALSPAHLFHICGCRLSAAALM